MTDKKEQKNDWAEDKSTWAIGGMTMVGVGVGLIFAQTAPILLVASILVGIGWYWFRYSDDINYFQ